MNKPFSHVTVIGTGTLGTQIALLAGNAGYTVTAYDTRKGILGETLIRLRASIETKGIKPFVPLGATGKGQRTDSGNNESG